MESIISKGKVLIVEDNPGAVKRLEQFIHNLAPNLETAAFSEAGMALDFARKETVSVFILDIQLADYKGTSLARQLRALPEYKYTPIIFETALAGEELTAYRDVKCYGFLIKPYGENEFKAVFQDALGLSEQIKNTGKTILIEQRQFILEYDIRDITYVEAFGKRLVIHTDSALSGVNAEPVSGYTLSRILSLIDDPSFVQCHKSYIVNKNHIAQIHKTERQIVLKGSGEKIPVGNKYQADLWG